MITYNELISKIKTDIYANPDEYILIQLDNILSNLLIYTSDGVSYCNGTETFEVPYKGDNANKGIGVVIQRTAENAKTIIRCYLSGDFNQCNKIMDEWWENQFKNNRHGLPATSITPNDYLYRIRINDIVGRKARRADLFHVPFQHRGKISTNRYSVLGYPCLYLGRSIYTCWEESHRPALNNFYVSAFKLSESIDIMYLLDFRLIRKSFRNIYDFKRYLCNLPMIIACSLRVNTYSDKFKPEYILPQLLLHKLIVPQDKITNWEGVVYSSTQVEDDFGLTSDCELADNIVIPIQKNNNSGWCEVLCNKFELTSPTNYEYELIKNPPQSTTIDGSTLKINENKSPFALLEDRLKSPDKFKHIDSNTGKTL